MLESSSEASGQRAAVHTLLSLVLSASAGAALGLGLLVALVLPNLHLGENQRIIELGRHLEAPPGAPPRLAFVGDSITRDGIDAEIVEEHAPYRLTAENLGMSGAGPNERRVLLPKLLATRPALVALGFHPANLCRLDALRVDKAYAYARAGFVAAWPAGRTIDAFPGMSPESFTALRSSAFAQTLHFRTAPVDALEHRVRALLRPDLRLGIERDWTRPYTRTSSIAGQRLESQLARERASLAGCALDERSPGWGAARALVDDVRGGGAVPVWLLLPVHPGLGAQVAAIEPPLLRLARELEQRHGATVVDARALLPADDFADAVHPNARGRQALSRTVAAALPAPGDG